MIPKYLVLIMSFNQTLSYLPSNGVDICCGPCSHGPPLTDIL